MRNPENKRGKNESTQQTDQVNDDDGCGRACSDLLRHVEVARLAGDILASIDEAAASSKPRTRR